MPATPATPSRNSLAIVGAGPVGLEAAAAALEAGLDVHVFERGDVGAHPLAWGHVRMFTPWRMNVGPASARLLARHGWSAPEPEERPTGAELVERLLRPLAETPELRERVHTHAQVVALGRRGVLKGDAVGRPQERHAQPFRLLVRDAGGRENVLHAFRVVDASGVYGSPNRAGSGGIPARGESYLAPQMSYRCDDVAGLARERHAGRRTLVIGGGATAATTVLALVDLAAAAPGTHVVWARRGTGPLAGEIPGDTLPARAGLFAAARALMDGGHDALTCIEGVEVDGFEYNSATHRYRVTLQSGEHVRVEEADEVVVNTGFGPDGSLYEELQVHECWASGGPMALSAARMEATAADALAMPAASAATLAHPEPDFFILGAKSYGRAGGFLLTAGYAQVAEILR